MKKRTGLKGFSLVEVLVVLAIIAILAAILLTVFSRVREQGRATDCRSNLKQIGLAFQMYADDNDHYLPPVVAVDSAKQQITWCDLTLPYTKTKQVYICQSDSLQTEVRAGWVISYAYNFYVAGAQGFTPSKTDAQILKPSATVLATDAGTTPISGLPPLQWPLTGPSSFELVDAVTASSGDGTAPHARHSGRTNVLWADGHVNSLPIEAFYTAPDHLPPGGKVSGESPCLLPNEGCP